MKTLKSIKRLPLSAMGVAMLLVLTGCVQVDKSNRTTYWFYLEHYRIAYGRGYQILRY